MDVVQFDEDEIDFMKTEFSAQLDEVGREIETDPCAADELPFSALWVNAITSLPQKCALVAILYAKSRDAQLEARIKALEDRLTTGEEA